VAHHLEGYRRSRGFGDVVVERSIVSSVVRGDTMRFGGVTVNPHGFDRPRLFLPVNSPSQFQSSNLSRGPYYYPLDPSWSPPFDVGQLTLRGQHPEVILFGDLEAGRRSQSW